MTTDGPGKKPVCHSREKLKRKNKRFAPPESILEVLREVVGAAEVAPGVCHGWVHLHRALLERGGGGGTRKQRTSANVCTGTCIDHMQHKSTGTLATNASAINLAYFTYCGNQEKVHITALTSTATSARGMKGGVKGVYVRECGYMLRH